MNNIIDRAPLGIGCSGNKPPPTVFDLFAKAVGARLSGMPDSTNEPGKASATADSLMGNLRDSQMTTSRGETIWN